MKVKKYDKKTYYDEDLVLVCCLAKLQKQALVEDDVTSLGQIIYDASKFLNIELDDKGQTKILKALRKSLKKK